MNVLIVDDDIATAEVIRDSIAWHPLGIESVMTTYHVAAAKNYMKEHEVDIVISDIEMPQETGLDLLKWVRNEGMECEFLLLTCHESFSYATDAITYQAAAYLTKPFDINIMTLNIQKLVTKILQKRSLQKNSEYGAVVGKNLRLMKLDFWKSILEGELLDEERIQKEIERRHLSVDIKEPVCFVHTKISNMEADVERYGMQIFEFILEGFHSEILTDFVENENVVKYHMDGSLLFFSICENQKMENLKEKCQLLFETSQKYFKSTITCCISNPYPISQLFTAKQRVSQALAYNIVNTGTIFWENEASITHTREVQILKLEKLQQMIENKERAQILHYLKEVFEELTALQRLQVHSLYIIKQEIMQVVYADLMKQGIQATKLFYDELSIKMAEHATDTTVDMIRWVNYVLEKTFQYEEEIDKSSGVIDKIHHYIHEHYKEEIGRNEIAAILYLTPEYLAKLYKKKTGNNLKDYINEYRIKQAKELLRDGERNISDVAGEVGFDNFSYFSTLFKKYTGMSPKDYKRGSS